MRNRRIQSSNSQGPLGSGLLALLGELRHFRDTSEWPRCQLFRTLGSANVEKPRPVIKRREIRPRLGLASENRFFRDQTSAVGIKIRANSVSRSNQELRCDELPGRLSVLFKEQPSRATGVSALDPVGDVIFRGESCPRMQPIQHQPVRPIRCRMQTERHLQPSRGTKTVCSLRALSVVTAARGLQALSG